MKLTAERIIDAGMEIFAEGGYHALSMRQVAERLDAQAGSLYYHVKNKNALLQLMADRVARQAYDAGTAALAALPDPRDWRARLEAQASSLRRSIQPHPGAALLLAHSPTVLSVGALSLMERLLLTLSDAGVPDEDRGIAADTILSHVTGFVLQEQSESVTPTVSAKEAAELYRRFPRTIAAGLAFDADEKFARSVRLLCAAVATLIAPEDRTPAESGAVPTK
ncbi:TetR/AcrR family transcriptional regulator [Solihabitans fulvus]|uniref:TetR/AcrR family transcriptional regulator n=1 Tax=Solihabitans fulvus TaxID=1892852 RepID=A0A5B2XBP9_9PSEU|nr:TetR family transcriptional regulator [Solihabitans fulvus]KAA2261067.1 TetR/AcrR family transcriptional regulator [Solihabitans fulvus]